MTKLLGRWLSAPGRANTVKCSLKTCVALSAIVAAGALATSTQAKAESDTRVNTAQGAVEGFLKNGVAEFLGIPYAAPPVGNLRWRPPAPPAPWTNVRNATKFGNICLQVTTLGPFAGPANANEDCLYLNVYSPDVHPARGEELPVIVWIHGGGNVDGGSNDYDGSKLATQGHTVVVTINYRLGLLGFMSHPAIDAEGHLFSNYGILDQQAALRWVQREYRQIWRRQEQRDARRPVRGLRRHGIQCHVAARQGTLPPRDFRKRRTRANAVGHGRSAWRSLRRGRRLRLRHGRGDRQMHAQPDRRANLPLCLGPDSTEAPYETQITQDGTVLPDRFVAAIENGQFNHMPIMSGTTEDEQNFSLGITEYFEKFLALPRR